MALSLDNPVDRGVLRGELARGVMGVLIKDPTPEQWEVVEQRITDVLDRAERQTAVYLPEYGMTRVDEELPNG